ncbi:MAG: Spy/CpxP family protein refolding chaperone [Vicinamibacteria bacterium]
MSETSRETKTSSGRRRWLWVAGGLLAGASVLAAVAAIAAPRAMAFHSGRGHGFRAHPLAARFALGHGRPGMAALLQDPAAAKEHIATVSEFVLRSVSATDEQKQKTKQITDRLVDQVRPLVERHQALHKAMVAELAKPEIDRAAIEKLRQDGMALADEASKIALAGVEDIGDVLTPDQRKELIELGRRLHGGAEAN